MPSSEPSFCASHLCPREVEHSSTTQHDTTRQHLAISVVELNAAPHAARRSDSTEEPEGAKTLLRLQDAHLRRHSENEAEREEKEADEKDRERE